MLVTFLILWIISIILAVGNLIVKGVVTDMFDELLHSTLEDIFENTILILIVALFMVIPFYNMYMSVDFAQEMGKW